MLNFKHQIILLSIISYCHGQFSVTTASGTLAPKGPYRPGQLIFEDTFDEFDLEAWQHENTLGGGGNNEFQW